MGKHCDGRGWTQNCCVKELPFELSLNKPTNGTSWKTVSMLTANLGLKALNRRESYKAEPAKAHSRLICSKAYISRRWLPLDWHDNVLSIYEFTVRCEKKLILTLQTKGSSCEHTTPPPACRVHFFAGWIDGWCRLLEPPDGPFMVKEGGDSGVRATPSR